ncbi:hypothetical protein BCR39DRAFT_543219 [Naematelia encephala]|uniref:Uncharacterized protein n=1 Tax=Naematelia encephala TaxID=71784 RepID=A0A1Y2ATY6_9TREE|nr:hypothetical protein BCR39DRAFT_543219 [Naematelia encephala]
METVEAPNGPPSDQVELASSSKPPSSRPSWEESVVQRNLENSLLAKKNGSTASEKKADNGPVVANGASQTIYVSSDIAEDTHLPASTVAGSSWQGDEMPKSAEGVSARESANIETATLMSPSLAQAEDTTVEAIPVLAQGGSSTNHMPIDPSNSASPQLTTAHHSSTSDTGPLVKPFVPSGLPPYHPPPDVLYPPNSIDNPHYEDLTIQPTFDLLPPKALYRPARLPADIDDRLDQSSVWMGVSKKSSEAVYFVPTTCKTCSSPSVNKFCDRGVPVCGRCKSGGYTCQPGGSWMIMRPRAHRKSRKSDINNGHEPEHSPKIEEKRFSTAEKGKGKVTSFDPSDEDVTRSRDATPEEDGGRGKRVRKKRRLSLTGEVDPETVNDDGIIAKKFRRKSRPTNDGTEGRQPALTADDKAWQARVQANAAKPPLANLDGNYPIWANTRAALRDATTYLRDPVKTVGGSVEIGTGGIARGVLLEGKADPMWAYWSTDESSRYLCLPLGKPRPRVRSPIQPSSHPTEDISGSTAIASPAPPGQIQPLNHYTNEAPEIMALLKSQRARTPVALAVAQDYSLAPFQVPRPFAVLGWFWVAEAWVVPVVSDTLLNSLRQDHVGALGSPDAAWNPQQVRWTFCFKWCATEKAWWRPKPYPPLPTETLSVAQDSGGRDGVLTLHSPSPNTADTPTDDTWSWRCRHCSVISEIVYGKARICRNEACPAFFLNISESHSLLEVKTEAHTYLVDGIGPPENIKVDLPLQRGFLHPQQLHLQLRPSEPPTDWSGVLRAEAGNERWRGWVCSKCCMANERRNWTEWVCDECHYSIPHKPRIYRADFLRPPSRPICTGPRQDDGFPSFPFDHIRSWTLYADDIKVVKHNAMDRGFGPGAEVHHALNTMGHGSHLLADKILAGMQQVGPKSIPFERPVLTPFVHRPSENQAAALYTYLCGPRAPIIEDMPTAQSVRWRQAPVICLDAADLINDRAGRMFAGEKERFNSVLFAAVPPQMPAALHPHINIEANSYCAFLFLGSDGLVKFRRRTEDDDVVKVGKQAELTVQHGDVVAVKTGRDAGMEVVLKCEGFGFVCVARRVYGNVDGDEVVDTSVSKDPNFEPTVPVTKGAKRKSLGIPQKAAKPLSAPLTDWYIGPRPLDRTQPLRVRAPLRDILLGFESNNNTDDADDTWTGTITIQGDLPPLTLLAPPPLPDIQKADTDTSTSIKGKKRGKEINDSALTPIAKRQKAAGKAKGKGNGKSRASIASNSNVENVSIIDAGDALVRSASPMNK